MWEPVEPNFNIMKTMIKKRFNCCTTCLSGFCCCCSKNTAQQLWKEEPLFTYEDCFGNKDFKDQWVSIKIKWTGPLIMNPYVLHPFVKIHVCDMNTMNYVAKENRYLKGTYRTEHACYFNKYKDHFDVEVDYYLPVCT